jgi:hypothetical protein
MKPIYQSDKDWCNAIATELWNDYWSKHNEHSI